MDAFAIYLRELRARPVLSADEERRLVRRAQRGNAAAADTVSRALLPWVVCLARRYVRSHVPLDELVAAGNLGLWKAVLKFDGRRRVRLTTFATHHVLNEIRLALKKRSVIHVPKKRSVIHVPLYLLDTPCDAGDGLPVAGQQAAGGAWQDDVERALRVASLDAIRETDPGFDLPEPPPPEARDPVAWPDELKRLTKQERQIVLARCRGVKYRVIAAEHGFSKQRAAQIYKTAIAKLRRWLKPAA